MTMAYNLHVHALASRLADCQGQESSPDSQISEGVSGAAGCRKRKGHAAAQQQTLAILLERQDSLLESELSCSSAYEAAQQEEALARALAASCRAGPSSASTQPAASVVDGDSPESVLQLSSLEQGRSNKPPAGSSVPLAGTKRARRGLPPPQHAVGLMRRGARHASAAHPPPRPTAPAKAPRPVLYANTPSGGAQGRAQSRVLLQGSALLKSLAAAPGELDGEDLPGVSPDSQTDETGPLPALYQPPPRAATRAAQPQPTYAPHLGLTQMPGQPLQRQRASCPGAPQAAATQTSLAYMPLKWLASGDLATLLSSAYAPDPAAPPALQTALGDLAAVHVTHAPCPRAVLPTIAPCVRPPRQAAPCAAASAPRVAMARPAAMMMPPAPAPRLPTGPTWPQKLQQWWQALGFAQPHSLHLAGHLWARVQSLMEPAAVAALGAPEPWEAAALACLWIAAKHEESRRILPAASRLAPLAAATARTLGAVELHVLGLLRWAPLAGWDDRHHYKGRMQGPYETLPPVHCR